MEPNPRGVSAFQLGAIAAITGVDLGALPDLLALIDPALAQPLEVGWRGGVRGLAVSLPIPTGHELVSRIEAATSPGRSALATVAGIAGGETYLELRSGDPISAAVRWIGARTPDEDRALLDVVGVERDTRDELVELLGFFAVPRGAVVAWSTGEIELGRVVPRLPSEILDALAGAAQVSAPQRALIRSVHELLARDQPILVSLAVTAKRLVHRLALRYAGMPWDAALRFVTGLYRGDSAKQLGAFAGAVRAQRVESLEVVLGPTEPPVAWVTAVQA